MDADENRQIEAYHNLVRLLETRRVHLIFRAVDADEPQLRA